MNAGCRPQIVYHVYLLYKMFLSIRCRFLQATVGGLHPTQQPSVRISAVRAVFGFCDHLREQESSQVLRPYLGNIMDGLVSVAQQYSSEVLALCMEALVVVISVRFIAQFNHLLNLGGGGGCLMRSNIFFYLRKLVKAIAY